MHNALANPRLRPTRGLQYARAEAPVTIEALHQAFAAFRTANDARLAEIERRGSADILATEQVDRINAALSNMESELRAQAERLTVASSGEATELNGLTPQQRQQHRAAFDTYFRRGDASALQALTVNAQLSGISNPDGGYLIPNEYQTTIDRVLMRMSAVRDMATVLPVNSRSYTKFVNQGGSGSNWVGETQTRTETTTPTLSELIFNVRTINAYPTTTQDQLDDAIIDVAAWLASEIDVTFGEAEGAAFVTGDGVKAPRGILSYPTVVNTSYAWGSVGYLAATGTTNLLTKMDDILALIYALKRGYRANASFLGNDLTASKVRLLKDTTNQYLWQPSNQVGEPATLAGYPFETDDNMPDIATSAYPLAFADFKRAYLIVDRAGTVVKRDDITVPGFVKFNTYKRVGGGIQNFEAIKLLQIN